MIITTLDQELNGLLMPIVTIVTILLNLRDELSPANTGVFPVVASIRSPLRSVFFGNLFQAFRLWSVVRIPRVGENRERGRGRFEGTLADFPAHVFCAVPTISTPGTSYIFRHFSGGAIDFIFISEFPRCSLSVRELLGIFL